MTTEPGRRRTTGDNDRRGTTQALVLTLPVVLAVAFHALFDFWEVFPVPVQVLGGLCLVAGTVVAVVRRMEGRRRFQATAAFLYVGLAFLVGAWALLLLLPLVLGVSVLLRRRVRPQSA